MKAQVYIVVHEDGKYSAVCRLNGSTIHETETAHNEEYALNSLIVWFRENSLEEDCLPVSPIVINARELDKLTTINTVTL